MLSRLRQIKVSLSFIPSIDAISVDVAITSLQRRGFVVSAVTKKTLPEKLETTTIDWERKFEKFSGLSDWRLQLAGLIIVTILLYAWLW